MSRNGQVSFDGDGAYTKAQETKEPSAATGRDEAALANHAPGRASHEDAAAQQPLPAEQPDQGCGVRGEAAGRAGERHQMPVLQRPFGAWNGTLVAPPAPHGAAGENCAAPSNRWHAHDPPPVTPPAPAAAPAVASAAAAPAGDGHRRNLSKTEELLRKATQELDSMQVCANGVSSRPGGGGAGDRGSGEVASMDSLVSQKVQRMLSENSSKS